MSLPLVPLDSLDERQHRIILATTINELIKVRPPNDRTGAERDAGVTPTNYEIPSHEECGKVIPNRYGTNTTPGTTDMTTALVNARLVATQLLPATVLLLGETYAYTDIGNWGLTGLTIEGVNEASSILKCTSTAVDHTALLLKAFPNDLSSEHFVTRCNLVNLKVEGNALTKYTVRAYGISFSHWSDVTAKNARAADGQAFNFSACSINTFEVLKCSTDMETQDSIPAVGIYLDTGTRQGVGLGAATDNTFTGCVMDGMPIGVQIAYGDGNLFLGGTSESCTLYGVNIVSGISRFNTFINYGMESLDSTADFLDGGFMTRLINCYTVTALLLGGDGADVAGGLHERVEIQSSGCTKNRVHDCIINYLGLGDGGFFDNGTATEWSNLYDQQAGAYVYPLQERQPITVTASPFTWTNDTGQYVEVIIQTGTITEIRRYRNGNLFLASIAVPGSHLLAPTDAIRVEYTGGAPGMSYLPHNGFQG